MANPMYGQNKADSHVGSEWIPCSASVTISGANTGYAVAPFASKVTGVMYNLTTATTTDVSVLTVKDADANVIDTVTVPVASINTGGVLKVDDSDADATVAEGEVVSLTSDGGSAAGVAVLYVRFERI